MIIHSIDILEAVNKILKDNYKYPIYLEDIKEGFDSPCFFLKVHHGLTQISANYFYNTATVYIDYLPPKGEELAEDLLDMAKALTELFCKGIVVQDRFFLVKNIQSELGSEDKDVLNFSFELNYHTQQTRNITNDIMSNLHLNERYYI